MRIATSYISNKVPNVAKMASTDKSRPILTALHLDVDRAVIEATDSYGLVCIPVEVEEGDTSGMVPVEAWKEFHKAHARNSTPSLSCLAGEVVFENTYEGTRRSWTRPEGQFPNVPALIPEEGNRSGFKFAVNAKLLARCAEALGTEVVTLSFVRSNAELDESAEGVGYFPSNMRPILVSNGNHGEAALVMPVRIHS